jgi:hypothetical protein
MSSLAKDLCDGQSTGLESAARPAGKWGAAQVTKIQATPQKGGNAPFKIPMIFWIDKASDLVVAQSDGALEPTMGYQYGDAVK